VRKVLLFAGGGLLVLLGVVAVAAIVLGRGRLHSFDVTPGPVEAAAGTYEVKLEHDGRLRVYFVHVPPAISAGEPLALVLALHGGGGRAQQMNDLTHFNGVADREGFLVAYPQGVSKNWNDGRPDSGSKAQKEYVDDVGFILAVIEDAATRLRVDRRRVYATGISNGAIMSNRLACEAPDAIAAVALVVGTAPAGFESACSPARPVPLLAFLSENDPLVPYEGGEITALFKIVKRGKVVSAVDLESFWASNNGCSGGITAEDLPDVITADDSTVKRVGYVRCDAGADVVFYNLHGSGHTWPGGKQYLSPWLVGTTNRDIDATELIWQFFAAHPMP
jgi:polyhydroxybutyrate depolymerase